MGVTAGVPFDPNYHQAGDDINNLDMASYETLADGGAHVLATLAEDRNLRATLAAGPVTAKTKKLSKAQRAKRARKAKKLSKAKKAKLGAYSGSRLIR